MARRTRLSINFRAGPRSAVVRAQARSRARRLRNWVDGRLRTSGGSAPGAWRPASCRGSRRAERRPPRRKSAHEGKKPARAAKYGEIRSFIAAKQREGDASALARLQPDLAADGGGVRGCAVFGFKGGQAGVEQLSLGHDDDVEPRRDLVTTENLSNQSFSTISLDRAAQLLRGGDAQAADRSSFGSTNSVLKRP